MRDRPDKAATLNAPLTSTAMNRLRDELPDETAEFDACDNVMRRVLGDAEASPSALKACMVEGRWDELRRVRGTLIPAALPFQSPPLRPFHHCLRRHPLLAPPPLPSPRTLPLTATVALEGCAAALSDHLSRSRRLCPRLSMLSNTQLLGASSQHRQIGCILVHHGYAFCRRPLLWPDATRGRPPHQRPYVVRRRDRVVGCARGRVGLGALPGWRGGRRLRCCGCGQRRREGPSRGTTDVRQL